MKGSNSRLSHGTGDRHSNVIHIQGGMITDSDLTVAAQIHQARDEAQNTAAMGSGCPENDGAVAISDDGRATLRPGWIIAQGKQGWLSQGEDGAPSLPLNQADLPLGPGLPNTTSLYYADLWERAVFAVQDQSLTDPGLHGAETSYRTRTMVQIKSVPIASEQEYRDQLRALEQNEGLFAQTGNAQAKVAPRNTEIATDDCDPCADQIDITPLVPNALFRFEVIAFDDTGANPMLTVAWSLENGAAIVPASSLEDLSARDAFARPNAVYEFFSEATEAQIGQFAGHSPERPVLTDRLFPVPAPGTANGGVAFDYVRRWDGFAEINLQTRTVTSKGTGTLTPAATEMTLTLDAFALTVSTQNSRFMAGDHWLVELRRFATEPERVRLVSPAPSGVHHHFCPLFRVDADGRSLPLLDAEIRRLSFPALSDIPASHVRFEPDCAPLFHNAENVQDALNALCDLNATEVAFDPGDNCPRLAGTTTVHDALRRMCQIQDDTTTTRMLRLMMDWGVVCGIKLSSKGGTAVAWTAGTLLDRAGRLIDVPAGSLDLEELPKDNILSDLQATMSKDGELCLSMAATKDGELQLFVSDRRTAFGPTDRTFAEAVEACLAGKKRVNFGGVLKPLKPDEVLVVENVVQVWANRATLSGAVPLSEADSRVAASFNKTLLDDYRGKASPERVERVEKLISLAEAEYNPGGARGTNRDILRMQLESTKLGIIANSEEEDRISCECDHTLPPCPPAAGDPPYLVPVACFRTDPGRDQKIINMQDFCTFCCRKQSQNWRSYRYYFGSVLEQRLAFAAEQCCRQKQTPNEGIDDWIGKWDKEIFEPMPFPLPRPRPEPVDPLWPPKFKPGFDEIAFPDWGGRPGLVTPIRGKDFVNVVKVDTLPASRARETLVGNGFDVVETIDLDDGTNPLERLGALGLKGAVRSGKEIGEPGDKIAMIVRGGKTVDYVVVEKGNGRLPFETDTELTERVAKALEKIDLSVEKPARSTDVAQPAGPAVDLSSVNDQLAALAAERKLAEASIRDMAITREALSNDVGKLREDLARSTAEFEAIEARKTASLLELSTAVSGLEAAKTEAAAIGRSIRAEQPARSLVAGDERAIKALEENGIVTVGDIANMNANSLSAVMRRAGVNMTGGDLKLKANELLNRR